nr:immunoglobulin light chain junction region [Macaca mulatta]
CMQSVDCPWTF